MEPQGANSGKLGSDRVPRRDQRRTPAGRPLWVNVFGALTLAFLLVVVVLHLTGHGMGPQMHGMHP